MVLVCFQSMLLMNFLSSLQMLRANIQKYLSIFWISIIFYQNFSWIKISWFYRFLIYVHLHPFEVRTSTLGHIQSKNFWFLVWMVWCVITQNVLFCKEIVVWKGVILTSANYNQKLECTIFFLEHLKDFINCDLVLYVIGRCDACSSFVGATSICWSICLYLGMWTMH